MKAAQLLLFIAMAAAGSQSQARALNQCRVLFKTAASPSEFELVTMGRQYQGEDKASLEGRLKAHYLDKRSRNAYLAHVKNGQLIAFRQELTKSYHKTRFIYVLSPAGELYLGPFADGPRSFYHSTFLRGKPVAAAGEMEIVNGHVYLNLGSGHYVPTAKQLEQMAEWFVRQGFPASRVHVSETKSAFTMSKTFLSKKLAQLAPQLASDSPAGRDAAQLLWTQHPEWIREIAQTNSLPGHRGMVLNLARATPSRPEEAAVSALLKELTFEVDRDAEFEFLFAKAPREAQVQTLKNLLFDLGASTESMVDQVTKEFLTKTASLRRRPEFQDLFQQAVAEASQDTAPGGMMASLLFVSHRSVEVRNAEMIELFRKGWPACSEGVRQMVTRRNVLSFMNQMAKEVVEFFE